MVRAIILLVLFFLSAPARADGLHFFTEHYPPYNYQDPQSGKLKGISVEIVQELMRRTGFDYRIRLAPWKRGYELTLSHPDTCLFTTGRTSEREDLFQWITPITDNPLVLFALKGRDIKITRLQDAAQYRIGGYLGDATVDHLVRHDIPVETVRDDALNLKKLRGKRIDLWATGEMAGRALADEMNVQDLQKVFVVTSLPGGIACNRKLNRIIITRIQKELDQLYRDGFIKQVYQKYRPGLSLPVYYPMN